MNRQELIHELADEVTRSIKRKKFKQDEYGKAIAYACRNIKSLKSEVGAVLNMRGQVKRAIDVIAAEEATK